jgi:AraC-like DNA-binding protein
MIASAGQDDARSDSVMNETLYTRIVAFIQQNLADPGLTPNRMPTTIGTVARRWGFTDSTHFSRRFRGAYGLSPREWRRLNAS